MTATSTVLAYLIKNLGMYISKESLSSKLNLSFETIFTSISELKHQGYEIHNNSSNGYALIDSQHLSQEIIQHYLHNNLVEIRTYNTVDSTNSEAKKIANQRQSNIPLIIISNHQTASYGRYGRNFESPENTGIYMSILLENNQCENFNAGLLTTAVSIAISRAIKKLFHTTPKIKWVNDVLLDNKKICGILTEGIINLEKQSISQVVIGVGINYTTPLKNFSDSIQKRVGSLEALAKKYHISRNQFIAQFLNEFFNLYHDYLSANFMDEYRQMSVVIGKEVNINQNGNITTGTVVAIDDLGRLVLKDGRVFNSGEVTKIRY